MSNTLLDFVMALVRDPEVAARYAADPAAALAGAELPGVTVADVQSLIPVVADSLAVATPDFGREVDAASVWTSGAAAAAFDAFDAAPAATATHHASSQFNALEADPSANLAGALDLASAPVPETVEADGFDLPAAEPGPGPWPDDNAWQPAHDPHPADHHPVDDQGFDLF